MGQPLHTFPANGQVEKKFFTWGTQGVSWKELAIFDGFCLVALSYFGGGELAFVSYFTWLARLASLFGRY